MADLPALRLSGNLPEIAGDTVVAVPTRPGEPAVLAGNVAGKAAREVAGKAPGDLTDLLVREKAKGEAGEVVSVQGPTRLLLFGVGDAAPVALRKAGAALARRAKGQPALVVDVRGLSLTDAGLRALAEGLLLASYSFAVKQAEPRALRSITVVVKAPEKLRVAIDRAVTIATATATARDLVNTPPEQKSPAWLATQAKTLLKGLDVHIRDEHQLAAEGWGGVLAVGQGSSRPPRVVEVTYRGATGKGPHIVLVGKGITFDTGGISIKPNASMLTMKMDMGGAAAVLATVRAVADLQLPLTVTAIACIAENMPSGSAQRPSDVIRHYDGTTVEVVNTDAEGRLVLADGLAYAAAHLNPDIVVDIATLTGAMEVALGKRLAGLFTPDDALAGQLEAAAAASGERIWRMPLVEDYQHALASPTADLSNLGDPKAKIQGGSIIAALFLQSFTDGRRWAHLDIAGPGWSGADEDELTKGGTGYGVRLLVRWLEALAKR